MRNAVTDLVAMGELPIDSHEKDEQIVARWQAAIERLEQPATDSEAIALLRVLPKAEGDLYGLSWSLVHFIESAPGWPLREAIVGDGYWVSFLRERADRLSSA